LKETLQTIKCGFECLCLFARSFSLFNSSEHIEKCSSLMLILCIGQKSHRPAKEFRSGAIFKIEVLFKFSIRLTSDNNNSSNSKNYFADWKRSLKFARLSRHPRMVLHKRVYACRQLAL
jgi:hypothetical protein